MTTDLPLVSIVIVNLNYGRFLTSAIESVLGQSCQDFELIIVDGGSSDESVDVIKRYEERIAWWCSEPDRGQSHAFNKGFAQAKGRFLTWLNADDLMLPKTVELFEKIANKEPDIQWITANFMRFTEDGKVIEAKWGPHYLPKWLQKDNSPITVFGPTTFFDRELYHKLGGMDVRLHYMMDTDLWLRFIKHGVKLKRLNHCCWAFRMHDGSKTAEFAEHSLGSSEKALMRKETRYVYDKTSYKTSRAVRYLQLAWRLLDGSLIRSMYRQHIWRRGATLSFELEALK